MGNTLLTRVQELTAQFHLRLGRETTEDAEAFVALMNNQYMRKVAPAYYFWQFFGASSPRACLMAEHEGRTVAGYGLWVLPYVGAQNCQVGLVTDLIIAPAFRGTGLLLRLEMEMETIARELGCVCIYAMPNAAAYRPRVSTLGWNALRERTTFLRQTCRSDAGTAITFEKVSRFEPEVDEVQGRFQRSHANLTMARRLSQALNWRFVDSPRYAYDLFTVRRRGGLFGYLVLKTYRDPNTQQMFGDIVDVLWTKDDPDALAAMLRFALGHFYDRGVPQAATWLETTTLLDGVGGSLGFVESPQKRFFCNKVLDEKYSWLADGARWFVTMAEAEIY